MNCQPFVLFFLLWGFDDVASVQVKIEQGWLDGQTLVTTTGSGEYHSFKGIPYAAPPVGDLRFRAPQSPINWEGTRNASEHGSVCVQYETYTSKNNIIGNEDCLFLNVYSPNLHPSTPLPVMFFIHGGYFATGSGNSDVYAPDFLVAHDVVLVTINYRLGVFGFLSVDTEDVPGNAGLKDQIAALKWIQKNIVNFGGDPNSVTIFGQSSGASSVSLHIVSPAAKGLFHRAAAMSGVFLNDMYIEFKPKNRAFALGRQLGSETNNPHKLVQYLRRVPPEILMKKCPEVLLSDSVSESVLTTIYFTPVVEKKFGNGDGQYLTEQALTLMRDCQINHVDVMMSHTALEGLRATALVENEILKYYPKYKQLLVPLKMSYYRSPVKVIELAEQVESFYFGNQSISLETIRDFINYYTYSHFVYDIHAYIEKLPNLSCKRRFLFEFGIYSSRNVYSKPGARKYGIKKATHKDDLPYLFSGTSYNLTVDVNEQAFKYVQLMCTLYTNFAKYGTPTPDGSLGFIWPEYEPYKTAVVIGETGKFSTLNITYDPKTSVGFWRQLYLSTGIDL